MRKNGNPTGVVESSQEDRIDSRELLRVLTAFKRGDFSVRMPPDQLGLGGKIADTLNDVLELNERMAKEFERINKSVGKEGKITQRASLGTTSGDWTHCVESINGLIGDLVQPSTEVARVIGAVAKGDLTQTMALDVDGRPLKGEFLRTARVVNTMVDQLNSFASEVTRVAREVGTEGKLGGQAKFGGVAGTWKDLTDSVNSMASNLTNQVRNIADVTTAVARGDLTTKITVDARGEILELKNTMNTMVDQLSSFASEVTRVAREVGTEGELGGQANVKGVGGVWKDLTESVNSMAGNLTAQVRNIADVTTAVANGDLSKKITVDVRGEILELKNTINTMVDQLNAFASEVTRVAREVGTEGKLGGQADVKGVGGVWKDLTDSVNFMGGNLTAQVRNIAEVTTAVANGDLSHKITVDVRGEILELKNTINTMVDQLNAFASEVTRVAREVGTEGKLGGQADVKGLAGTWKDLTDSVNSMARQPDRSGSQHRRSHHCGSQRRFVHANYGRCARRNSGTEEHDQHDGGSAQWLRFGSNPRSPRSGNGRQTGRPSRREGRRRNLEGPHRQRELHGRQFDRPGPQHRGSHHRGRQRRSFAQDHGEVRGEILELKNTINTMVDQLNGFASEVTRVAREVGTEGKLGGQAEVKGVAGTWKDLTDSVNSMAGNLTNQVRNIARSDDGRRQRRSVAQDHGRCARRNSGVEEHHQHDGGSAQWVRVRSHARGPRSGYGRKTGRPGGSERRGRHLEGSDRQRQLDGRQPDRPGPQHRGSDHGGRQRRPSRKITVDVRGEILELKNTINTMVDQLNAFASEVTRVAREVGTEGKLGGQADVRGVGGVWKDLTDSVNSMAGNLTGQVRNIAEVTTAVASGDLSRKITVDVRGEILELKNTINVMVDQLNAFASEVTRVAREVGTEGKLGGQADVRGVAGSGRI